MIWISNNGQGVVETNYWESDMARQGLAFLSWNAGAARLLLPSALLGHLQDMRTAKWMVLSRGRWEAGKHEALELLFEDGSDEPFCLHMATEQSDRLVPASDSGKIAFFIWTAAGQQLSLPAWYRMVRTVPDLSPLSRSQAATMPA